MNNIVNAGAPTSSVNLAKQAKELINKVESKKKGADKSPAGLENPCVFGIWNKNFDNQKSL